MGIFFRTLRSLELAVGSISYLLIGCALASLVPQGLAPETYRALYPGALAELILRTGFADFFSSPPFLIPIAVFFLNLTACTAHRFFRAAGRGGDRRYGPMLLHVGLMVLVLSAGLSSALRQEGFVSLAPGEMVSLPRGIELVLLDFSTQRAPDGRPTGWTSTVRLIDDRGATKLDGFEIKVNKPLRTGGITLYQSSYGRRRVLKLRDPGGGEHFLAEGQEVSHLEETAAFMAADPASGTVALRVSGPGGVRIYTAPPGGTAGAFDLLSLTEIETSGIEAVRDGGYPFVVTSFVLIAIGLFLTAYRKLGEMHENAA